jgi:hypothetical protein
MVGAANIDVRWWTSISVKISDASKPPDSGTMLTPSRATVAMM